ncbi:MAG TPA: hypothetical protein VE127_13420 [Solirubrobacteraceae bacterium]|nr:hypothetical protein [Solirubrobacteraceae bacterium]
MPTPRAQIGYSYAAETAAAAAAHMSKLAFTMNWQIWDLGGRFGADDRRGAG